MKTARLRAWMTALLLSATVSCAGQPAPLREETPVTAAAPATAGVTYKELDELNRSLADRYVSRVADACGAVRLGASTRAQRSKALALRIQTATAAYDIVSARDPLTQMENLLVLAELQAFVGADDGGAIADFGEREGALLKSTLIQARDELRTAAARTLPAERMESIRSGVRDWRRGHPQSELVTLVRKEDLPASSPVASGFVLGALNDAVHQVEETRLLGERALYFTKRMPMILSWHLEAITSDLVERPETTGALESVRKATDSLERAVAVLEKAPEILASERKALFAALDEREKRLTPMLAELHGVVRDSDHAIQAATELMKEMRATVKEAEPLAARLEKSKPVELKEVSAAALESTRTLQELRAALRESRELLDSPAWTRRMEDANRIATERLEQASSSARSVAWILVGGALAVAALGCGTLIATRRPRA